MFSRRRLLRAFALLLIGSPFLFMLFLACAGPYSGPDYADKLAPPDSLASPLPTPRPLRIHAQHEGHTCGFHAVESLYEAYGLDADELHARFRLGTDVPALPGNDEWLGTLHPDLYRVLTQDGFAIVEVNPTLDIAAVALSQHLAEHCALALVRLPGGGLHWIALDASDGGGVRVIDSLRDEPLVESGEAFLEREVLSLLLVRPAGRVTLPFVPHKAGLLEMNRVRARMK